MKNCMVLTIKKVRHNFWINFLACFCFFIMLAVVPAFALAESYLQVMAVENEASAKAEADRLENLGIPSFVKAEAPVGKEVLYRVYIGPFDDDKEAASAGNHLKSQGTIKEFVLRVESAASPAVVPGESALADVPYIGAKENDESASAASQQTPPAVAPAPVPTYGEKVSPEMAQELGSTVRGVPQPHGQAGTQSTEGTYGQQNQQSVTAPSAPAIQIGDNMPGIIENTPAPGGLQKNAGEPLTYGEAEKTAKENTAPIVTGVEGAVTASDTGTDAYNQAGQYPAASVSVETAPVALDSGAQQQIKSTNKKVIPAKPTGPMKVQGFSILVDLSSSMRRMSNCGGRIKEEAVASLLRKINHRIPSHPYTAVLRVFGYKNAVSKSDFTTTYYGPSTYERDNFENAIAKLVAADSVSPFGAAISSSSKDLSLMNNPKVVLMFSDFEESAGAGNPVKSAELARRTHNNGLTIYTFYCSRQGTAVKLAKSIANAGGGKTYDICHLLENSTAFEDMMMEIFGPSDEPPCDDLDEDGVCDKNDECPNTPIGAPVDERGCWIAAYSQFFDFDKAEVKSAFLPRIEHAAGILNKNPSLPRVIIAGHTDGVGTEVYNMELGRKRAQAVKDLLVKYGVDANRLVVESYGKDRPIADNGTEEGRAKNRRVEFHIGDMPPMR